MIHSYKLSSEAFEFIISESAYYFPNETGGILAGKVEGDCVLIQHATGPGPTANHELTRFKRDGDYSQEVLDVLVQDSGGEIDYIGEWHSHPIKSRPSPLDIKSMSWIATNEKYAIKEPIMLLCVGAGVNRWEIRCFTLFKTKLRLLNTIN